VRSLSFLELARRDIVGDRFLTGSSYTDAVGMTVESCITFCQNNNYNFAGLEYGQECYCDFALNHHLFESVGCDECDMSCVGNAAETCGGPLRVSLYQNFAVTPPPLDPEPVASVGTWTYQACYPDSTSLRTLERRVNAPGENVTAQSCTADCASQGFSIAGLEYGQECWCGDTIQNGVQPTGAGSCDMTCNSDRYQNCGGSGALAVFTNSVPSGPTTVPSVGDWTFQSCYTDSTSARTLERRVNAQGENVNAQSCTTDCQNQGFTLAGLEYGQECWCGNTIQNGAQPGAGCTMACVQTPSQTCGGPDALTLYSYSA